MFSNIRLRFKIALPIICWNRQPSPLPYSSCLVPHFVPSLFVDNLEETGVKDGETGAGRSGVSNDYIDENIDGGGVPQ